MEATDYEGLVEVVVSILEMTLRHFEVRSTDDFREKEVVFTYEICDRDGGKEFAFIRLGSDPIALCFRRRDNREIFFLAGRPEFSSEMSSWLKAAKKEFAKTDYQFERIRVVEDLDRFLSNLAVAVRL